MVRKASQDWWKGLRLCYLFLKSRQGESGGYLFGLLPPFF